jgi:hypothetical protein
MNKFTHGIIAVDPENVDENDMLAIVHFVGLWSAPNKEQFDFLANEIRTDPEFGLIEIADRLEIVPAPQWLIDEYNLMMEKDQDEFNPELN